MNSENFPLRRQHIHREILNLQKQIELLPEGKLLCVKNGAYFKYFRRYNGDLSYIPKKQRTLAEQLAIKTYLSCRLKDLKEEQAAISAYLRRYDPQATHTNQLLARPAIQKLLSGYFRPLSLELCEWSQAPYERNPRHPEALIHKSISGNVLRSKSEVIIDMLLYQSKIPYRYECPLNLNGAVLYPDFTARHPLTGRTYYWEHFGMMDQDFYIQNFLKKMQLYLNNGIVPECNLITTFETKSNPLTPEKVREQIHSFFADAQ